MMNLQLCIGRALIAGLAATGLFGTFASAQTPTGMITSFEPPGPTEVTNPLGYFTGSVLGQDLWNGGSRAPRVQTAEEIAAELTAAGLNAGVTTHSGSQALLVAKLDTATETTGYFVRNPFFGLESTEKVTMDFWVRPLTSGLGADPAGTPAGNEKTIGERQGNNFYGIMDEGEVRAAAIRFGIVVEPGNPNPYTNASVRTIDFASASAGAAVWVPSGLTWTADTWYNFTFELDYGTKTYDLFLDGTKVNADPIRFYTETSQAATRFFVSRGTNQAGSILDDVNIFATPEMPVLAGDFDEDGDVDGNDFLVWQQDFSVGSLDDWKANYGMTSGGGIASVPEPGSMALALSAMALGMCRRRSA
jgi:hypothetical protein